MRTLGVLALLSLSACPAKPPDQIAPTDAKTEDLVGYWVHWPTDAMETRTTLAYASAVEAPWELPLLENDVDAGGLPTSIVYDPDLKQIATFEVKSGAIEQTVLGDVNALPGTKYSTKILALTSKQSLTLESKRVTSGQRTYEYFERCPVPNEAGWSTFGIAPCPIVTPLGGAVVIDRLGDVHSTMGIGAGINACEQPVFADVTRGCEPRLFAAPSFNLASLTVGSDDVIRFVWAAQQGSALNLREKPLRGDVWTDTVIDAQPGTVLRMRSFDDAKGRTVVTMTSAGASEPCGRYDWNGSSWVKSVMHETDGGVIVGGALNDVTRGADGALLLSMFNGLARETPAGFERLTLPNGTVTGTAVRTALIDSRGRVQMLTIGQPVAPVGGMVAGNSATFSLLEGGTWTQFALPTMWDGFLVPHPDGTPRLIISLEKASKQTWVLLTLNGDHFDQQLLNVEEPFGTTPAFYTHPGAAVGADGTIAFTADGTRLWVLRPGGPLHPRSAQVKLLFQGKSGVRIRSTDGKVDCTTDCTVEYPVGSRFEAHVEPQPGFAGTLTCFESQWLGRNKCWVNVRKDVEELVVGNARTPVRASHVAGGMNGVANAFGFGLSGTRGAYQTELNPGGLFAVDGTPLPLSPPSAFATHGLAVYDRATGLGWHTAMPVQADAVAPADDGGAWALVTVSNPTPFGNVMVGTAGKRTIARLRYDANGVATGAVTLVSASSVFISVSGRMAAAALQPDGSAAVVINGTVPPLTDQTALVRVDAAGTVQLVGLDAMQNTSGAVVVEQARTFVAVGPQFGSTKLLALDASGVITGTRTLAGAQLIAVSLRGARHGVMVGSGGASIDLGLGARTGQYFVAEYDAALTPTVDAVAMGSTTFTLLPEGGGMLIERDLVFGLDASLRPVATVGDSTGLGTSQYLAWQQTPDGFAALIAVSGVQSQVFELRPSPR